MHKYSSLIGECDITLSNLGSQDALQLRVANDWAYFYDGRPNKLKKISNELGCFCEQKFKSLQWYRSYQIADLELHDSNGNSHKVCTEWFYDTSAQ